MNNYIMNSINVAIQIDEVKNQIRSVCANENDFKLALIKARSIKGYTYLGALEKVKSDICKYGMQYK